MTNGRTKTERLKDGGEVIEVSIKRVEDGVYKVSAVTQTQNFGSVAGSLEQALEIARKMGGEPENASAVWIAEMETSNFTFHAVGESKADAMHWLEAGLRKHAQACGVDKFWEGYDVTTRELKRGACYRDWDLDLLAGESGISGEVLEDAE